MGKTAVKLCLFLLLLAGFGYVVAHSLMWSQVAGLNHDEHQFLASAFLFHSQGLQPYRDYAYFHTPNLIYIYSALFNFAESLRGARVLTGLCGIGICLVLFIHGAMSLGRAGTYAGLLLSLGIVILFFHFKIYKNTLFYSWNHASSVLFAVTAYVLVLHAGRRLGKALLPLLAGLSLGMAVGIRLNLAPLFFPLAMYLLLYPAGDRMSRIRAFCWFLGGCVLANLPSIYFLLTEFKSFWFGNITYHLLSAERYLEIDGRRPVAIYDKLVYLGNMFASRTNLQLLSGIVLASLLLTRMPGASRHYRAELLLAFGCLAVITAGCLVPSPSKQQYFFALFPFLVLTAMQAAALIAPNLQRRVLLPLVCAAVVVSTYTYSPALQLDRLREFYIDNVPTRLDKIYSRADQIKEAGSDVPNRQVLTLSPIYAIEAGYNIHPMLATGPFAFRIVPYAEPEQIASLPIIGLSELLELIANASPGAVLTGAERSVPEDPLDDAAENSGYVKNPVGDKMVFWVRE